MNTMNDIRHRLRSVSETRKITQAMHMISVAKIKKAMTRYEANQLHFRRVRMAMKDILFHLPEAQNHPFVALQTHEGHKTAYIVVASDKGMAGGYNGNVCKAALQHMAALDKDTVVVYAVGNMARAFFEKRGYTVDDTFVHVAQSPQLYHARMMVEMIQPYMVSGEYDQVFIAFTRMYSSASQVPKVYRLLPLRLSDLEAIPHNHDTSTPLTYEPDVRHVMDQLAPQYVLGLLYGMLVQSYASEHCMRMHAMEGATRNADELIAKLRVQYNRMRQAAITQEISEIIAAVEALE